jgi:hypothetical protein
MKNFNDVGGWATNNEQCASEWVQWEQEKIFGTYFMPHPQIFLKYYHSIIFFGWCVKIFPDEAQNILPHGRRSNVKTQIIILVVVLICSNGVFDFQH